VSKPVVEEVTELLGRIKPRSQHSQTCPCWTAKAPIAKCECWILSQARDQAEALQRQSLLRGQEAPE
jgi:hypothetical protein